MINAIQSVIISRDVKTLLFLCASALATIAPALPIQNSDNLTNSDLSFIAQYSQKQEIKDSLKSEIRQFYKK
jgi:recombinational DNA repair protein (RecF pathway)